MKTRVTAVAAGATEIIYVPPYTEPPYAIALSPRTGGTGTLYISNTPVSAIKAGNGVFKLYDGSETGWSTGVAAEGARPAVITHPITAIKVGATSATCDVEANF